MQVHCPTEAVLIHLTISALAGFHPCAVAEGLKTVFPNVEEVVLIDVALRKTAVDVGTGADRSVHQNGGNGDACAAEIKPVADLALVGPDVSLAAELRINLPLLSRGDDEVQQLAQLFTIELQIRVGCGTTDRLDAEETPRFHMMLNQKLFHRFQLIDILWADACHHIVCREAFLVGNQVDGMKGVVETARAFAESVVGVAQAVEADGDTTKPSVHKLLVSGFVVSIAVADDAPREAMLPKLPPAIGQVRTHQRLSARDDHQNRIAFELGFQRFNRVQKILKRHVLVAR